MDFIREPLARGILKIAPISTKGSVYLTPENISDTDLLTGLKDIVDICGTNPMTINVSINTSSSKDSGRTSDLNMHKDILGRTRSFEIEMPPLTSHSYQALQELFLDLTENIDYEKIVQKETNLAAGTQELISVQNNTAYTGFNIYAKMHNNKTGWAGTINATVPNTPGIYSIYLQDYYNKNGVASITSPDDIKALGVKITEDNKIQISVGKTFNFDATAENVDNFSYTFLQLDATHNVDPTVTNDNLAYVVWYLIEYKSPEMNTPIREIVYVGDSSFTNYSTEYRPKIVDGNKIIDEIYVKNLKINLIAKTAKMKKKYNYDSGNVI